MSGVMEILLIVAIALGIIMLPRLMNRRQDRNDPAPDQHLKLTGWLRLAIVASLLWPALTALYLKPWNGHWVFFLYLAAGPLAAAWGCYWVWSGFKKRR